MKNKVLQITILILAVSIIVISTGRIGGTNIYKEDNKHHKDSIPEELSFINSYSSDFSHFIHDTVTNIFRVYDSNGNIDFNFLLSSPYCDNIRAWGGVIKFAIILNNSYEIKGLELIEHYETQSWIDGLKDKGFFDTWNNMDIESAYKLDVDAISGSTITSQAIIECIKIRLEDLTELEKQQESNIIKTFSIDKIISLLIVVLALLSFIFPSKLAKFRIILLASSIIVLGFWNAHFLSIALLFNWLVNGLSIITYIILFLLLLLSFLIPLFTNKSFYCQYICPYGAAQELVGKVNKKKVHLSNKQIKYLSKIRYILLFIIFLIIIFKIDVSLEDFEPFSAFQVQFASGIVLSIAIVMLILSVFSNKPWCRFFCPTGAVLSMLRSKKTKSTG